MSDSSDKEKVLTESSEESEGTDEGSFDALIRDYDNLSSTPRRTQIHRRQLKKKDSSACKITFGCKKNKSDHHLGSEEDHNHSGRRKASKREIQLSRHSARNIKLEENMDCSDQKDDTVDGDGPPCNIKIESSKRFLSLSCKLIKTAVSWKNSVPETAKNRADFHDFFEKLVKSGNLDKDKLYTTQLSEEEHLWQTELNDMIWLELQAWKADRTVLEQDRYLCEARKEVPHLLDAILNYRFEKILDRLSSLSSQSSDSGVFAFDLEDASKSCSGCMHMFCPSCLEHAEIALKEVGDLLHRLDTAESLFPSSKTFGNHFPQYRSRAFIGRVKAMCLWYNIMRHHRLKIIILGKQLLTFAQKGDSEVSNSSTGSFSPSYKFGRDWTLQGEPFHCIGKYFRPTDNGDTRTYRKFIEDVLKIKGLKKALLFLEKLYSKVLKKARIALEKNESCLLCTDSDDYELRRYGYWSNEYKSLNLPSFRQAFIFISRIPLDVIHEFLIMRLETKLEKPSILSIRQLIKELKEGLRLSVLYKQRYSEHLDIAFNEPEVEGEIDMRNKLQDYIHKFDESVYALLKLYLNYLEQWFSSSQDWCKIQKNLLEEEWKFITSITPSIPYGESLASTVFCDIFSSILKSTCTYIKENVNHHLQTYDQETSLQLTNTHRNLQFCRGLQTLFICVRDKAINIIILTKKVVRYIECNSIAQCEPVSVSLSKMRDEALELYHIMKVEIAVVENKLLNSSTNNSDNPTFISACRSVLHQMYKFTFEYYKEVWRIIPNKKVVARDMFTFCEKWFSFVKTYCEKGRGVRPRWANYGVEFLVYISSPKYTVHLSDSEFQSFRAEIEDCFNYIIGAGVSNSSAQNSVVRSTSTSPYHNRNSFGSDGLTSSLGIQEEKLNDQHSVRRRKISQENRVITAVEELNKRLEEKLRNQELIGTVITSHTSYDRNLIKPKAVTFSWQRGIKIGQGRFGKVYTAVNIESGELLAMKEIPLSPNDCRTIKNVALEMKIFEGIKHENLVRYYGAEIHREELLIFMELCPEGTLESLVMSTENGLPESIVRRYTKQLVNAIATLHGNSIVHRDIKPANIFLTSEGNCLKLGDFGSAVKIKAHTTAPGELKGFVGTQAYMAPEVFMKSNSVGHGRAVDIWSLGCVVIEMASGKRPWSEYDSHYQIMFKVGMGETPAIPDSLSEEGKLFILNCVKHNHKKRATINQLMHDNFLKVDSEEEGFSYNLPSVLEDFLKLGIKR